MITPIRDNVLARMIDWPGQRTTAGGLIVNEEEGTEGSVRPRWFEVTHVGKEQEEFSVGDYVLVAHGRWSRGIDVEGTRRNEDKLFLLDLDEILATSDDNPVENVD